MEQTGVVLSKHQAGGRATALEQYLRRNRVEALLEKRMTRAEIVAILGNDPKTITNDIKAIKTEMLTDDDKWFERKRLARIEVTKSLDAQYKRLMANLEREGDLKDKSYVEQLITNNRVKYFDIKTTFDPEQYIDHVAAENALKEKLRDESGKAGSA